MDATNLGPAELAKEEESPTVIFQFDVCHGLGLSRIGTSEPTSGILDRILEEFELSNRCSTLKARAPSWSWLMLEGKGVPWFLHKAHKGP